MLPNPQAHVLVEGVPYGFVWCASDYIDSCTLSDPALVWERPGDAGAGTARSSLRCGSGTPSFPRVRASAFVTEIVNRITPRFPRPPLWLAVGLVALLVRRPAEWRTIVVLWAAAFLVLLVHAASQGVAPEFALPLYPVFIVTALGALAGERRPAGSLASTRVSRGSSLVDERTE